METRSGGPPHILVVGGGYVGMYTALRLLKKLRPGEGKVTIVDTRSFMTYQPFLPEAAAGNLEPRHVVVPLRRVLKGGRVITGRVTRIDHARRVARLDPTVGESYEIAYDILVLAPGSVSRTLPIPGLAEHALGFKGVEEAIALRNKVLEQMDLAQSVGEQADGTVALKRALLTFVFVGGGYAGVEALGESQDMAADAARYYDRIAPGDMRWVLVEAAGRILPEVGEEMGRYTVEQLRARGIEVRLKTRLESCTNSHVVLSDGDSFDAGTIVWTAGVKPNPLIAATDLPRDDHGRLKAQPTLQVDGVEHAWTAGDAAAVPDLTRPGELCAPSAQHAVRQARCLADNIVAVLRGAEPVPYEHAHAGSVASLGLHKGVAQVYGVKLKGYPAWLMHRTYHLSRVPTLNRKARVAADWTLALFFHREAVALGSIARPYDSFRESAAATPPPPALRVAGSAEEPARPA